MDDDAGPWSMDSRFPDPEIHTPVWPAVSSLSTRAASWFLTTRSSPPCRRRVISSPSTFVMVTGFQLLAR